MDATDIIIIVVALLVLLAVIAFVVARSRKKARQHQAAEASRLRQEAQQHAATIPESQVRAKEAEVQAERARIEAQRAEQQAREAHVAATQQEAEHEARIREADRLDPHVDTRSQDYTPDTRLGSGPGAGAGGTSSLPTTGAHPGHETPVDADDRPLDQGPLHQGSLDQGTVDPRQDPDLGGTHRA